MVRLVAGLLLVLAPPALCQTIEAVEFRYVFHANGAQVGAALHVDSSGRDAQPSLLTGYLLVPLWHLTPSLLRSDNHTRKEAPVETSPHLERSGGRIGCVDRLHDCNHARGTADPRCAGEGIQRKLRAPHNHNRLKLYGVCDWARCRIGDE